MPLDPISTVHPMTGAIRPVTPDLLAETYLTPGPAPFEGTEAICEAKNAPWAESLKAAPEATITAVSNALRELIEAAPSLDPASVQPELLPAGRARDHLTTLRDLWRDIGSLPHHLAPLKHALEAPANHALEPLPLLSNASMVGATAADKALASLLKKHHGEVSVPDAFPGLAPAGSGALGQFQSGARGTGAPVSAVSLRDPLQELRFAAARAQRLLDEGAADSGEQIGLLLPNDPAWLIDAEAAFSNVGLNLGGVPGRPVRDRAGEALHLILTVLNKPAPGMAAVALDALGLGSRSDVMRSLLARSPDTNGKLRNTLRAIANHMPPDIAASLVSISTGPVDAPIDWDGLIAANRPASALGDPVSATEGAVAVFIEGQTPWREVRHLLALGFAGDRFPSVTGSGPFWLEHEIDQIERHCGIALPGRRKSLELARACLNRQFSAVSERIEITVPVRDRSGSRLAPSASLDLLAYRLETTAEELIKPLPDTATDWPCDLHHIDRAAELKRPGAQQIDLGCDLTGLRVDDNGVALPQSPSRLETLLVSPLAWLLGELGIQDRSWGPDGLDALVRGSLMHKALEAVFPPGAPPSPEAAAQAVEGAVDDAIATRRDLRFLAAPAWSIERRQVVSELTRAATKWAEMLRDSGATIHATEEYLQGEAFGMGLHGKADTLLKLPDGTLLVIDYKSGKSTKRVERMEGGWDVQAQLYGDMIARGDLGQGAKVAVGYLNLADMVAVTGGTLVGEPFGPIDVDTHANAKAQLTETVRGLRSGLVTLNTSDDAGTLTERGIGAYALDDPLVAAFLWEESE